MFVAVCTVVRLIIAPYLHKTPPHLRSGGYSLARFFNEVMDAIVYAGVFVFLLIRPFFIQTFTIPSGSMLETLQISDYIVANKGIYRYSDPKVGDIVVFRPPVHAVNPDQLENPSEVKVDFIKRLIGGPGDLIEIKGEKLFRNGQFVDEPYVSSKPLTPWKLVNYKGEYWPVAILNETANTDFVVDKFRLGMDQNSVMKDLLDAPAAAIPKDHYLFMGDNRAGSSDGRSWGLIHRSAIIGRAEVIWFPISRWRRVH